MIAFEISVNAEKAYRAGIGEHGFLRCAATWTKYDKESSELSAKGSRVRDQEHASWPS